MRFVTAFYKNERITWQFAAKCLTVWWSDFSTYCFQNKSIFQQFFKVLRNCLYSRIYFFLSELWHSSCLILTICFYIKGFVSYLISYKSYLCNNMVYLLICLFIFILDLAKLFTHSRNLNSSIYITFEQEIYYYIITESYLRNGVKYFLNENSVLILFLQINAHCPFYQSFSKITSIDILKSSIENISKSHLSKFRLNLVCGD